MSWDANGALQGELLDEAAVERRGKAKGDEYLFNLDLFALDAVEHRLQSAGLRRKALAPGTASAQRPALVSVPAAATVSAAAPLEAVPPKTEHTSDGRNVDSQSSSLGSKAEESQATAEESLRNVVMDEVEGSGYLVGIDAKWWGNVGRFFNHSCNPNMEKQPVFTRTHDLRLPSLSFFTNCDVPAYTELT